MAYMNRLFTKSNTSFLLTSGKALQSEVVRLNKDTFLVDTGLKNPRICKQDELVGVPKDPKVTRFTNTVGFLDMVAGETSIQKNILERFFIDLVTGDAAMKAKAAARLNDLVGPCIDAVPGEPQLLLPRKFRHKLAGMELKRLQRRGARVNGIIVNSVGGGYTVAVAGYIAYLRRANVDFRRTGSFYTGKFNINLLKFEL